MGWFFDFIIFFMSIILFGVTLYILPPQDQSLSKVLVLYLILMCATTMTIIFFLQWLKFTIMLIAILLYIFHPKLYKEILVAIMPFFFFWILINWQELFIDLCIYIHTHKDEETTRQILDFCKKIRDFFR